MARCRTDRRMPRGQFHHVAIAGSARVAGEKLIGWGAHYLIGILFAALLMCFGGMEWFRQPGMGAGIAASKTPNPTQARLHSVITHTLFGVGLYVTGRAVQGLFGF